MENQDLQDFQGIEETRQDATNNKSGVQKFAQQARELLNEGVRRQAFYYGVTAENWQNVDPDAATVEGRVLSDVERRSRKELIARARQNKSFDKTMEEAAYGWFNRLIALRYMEVNNYLPSRVRVFTDANGAFRPEILDAALEIDLPGLDRERVVEALENNETAALYRYLLLLQCNALNAELPRLFEPMGGYSEILLPTNVLSPDGVIGKMVEEIPDKYWLDQVQIVGWLYQYYNAAAKAETYALLKKNVKITQERVPFATQLFTPDWIVRYMVENSLGRLAISARLREEGPFATEAARIERERALAEEYGWRYYLPEAEQTPEVRARLDASAAEFNVENAKIIDPCAGSGHILVYAFDVLMQIYKRRGFADRDAVLHIVEKNLYGLDIDERAAQLAYFAVAMKARQYDRRFLTRGVEPQVYSPQGWEDGEKYGSLFHGDDGANSLLPVEEPETSDDPLLAYTPEAQGLRNKSYYSRLLAQEYDVVVTNPPYLATSNVFQDLANFAKKYHPDGKSDLSTAFMEQAIALCKENGCMAMINIPTWMFLSSYENLRASILKNNTITSMVHPGRGIFGSDFGTTTFVIAKASIPGYLGTYRRLFKKQGEVESPEEREAAFLAGEGRYEADQANFAKIPGAPIAYWASEAVVRIYSIAKLVRDYGVAKQGIATGENDRFMRYWYEPAYNKTACPPEKEKIGKTVLKWFPYHKGGECRKWYGNNDFVVNWENDGFEIKNFYDKNGKIRSRPQNLDYAFRSCTTWSLTNSSSFGARFRLPGFMFDINGMSLFTEEKHLYYSLAYLCSKVAFFLMGINNPTMASQSGDIARLPFIVDDAQVPLINQITTENIALSKADWDAFETSWDFTRHPLVRGNSVAAAFAAWEAECDERFRRLKANEEELNRIFIDIYGLADELTPEVDEKDVTVRRADLVRDVKSLISYAVGCMFGRYSLEVDGLAYAGGDWDASKYGVENEDFTPDEDAIIPICDDDYFKDDATTRFAEWLKFAFGAETLDENLRFIAVALGGDGKAPKETIRAYFLNGFFKDHVQTYQKRPIYWLFDSGKKNGFKALHYVHRYRPDTIARLRVKYVHELQGRYRAQLERLDAALDAADLKSSERVNLTKRRKKLDDQAHELRKYEEKVRARADEKRVLDLDDGVKHNYALFADILASIK